MMNPEIKQRWLTALRSGEYSQTRDKLKNEQGFCCLGVLCDLYSKEKGVPWEENGGVYSLRNPEDEYDCSDTEIPEFIQEWAGVDMNPDLVFEDNIVTCIDANDDLKLNFNEIADLIEKEL